MKTFLNFVLFFLLAQIIQATNFYCDPINGSIINDGSKENPWGTLENVLKKGITFKAGDVIYLLSGNHGNIEIVGNNEKYISVKGLKNHKPIINSLVFGTDELNASKWTFSNITFKESSNSNIVFIHKNSSKIRLLENHFESNKSNQVAIEIKGNQCKIEHNVMSHFKNGISVFGLKNQIRNNRIEFFSNKGIDVFGSYNLFEYNLIKESIATDAEINSGIYLNKNEVKGNVFRGNTIINFIKESRNQIGFMHGIYGENIVISESIFENNVVVSNGENGIFLKGELHNLKIVNNTVANPYFGLEIKEGGKPNMLLSIKVIGVSNSSNIIVRNNLSNNVLFENIKGIADHNLTIPVSVHDFDLCFNNWALFDFSLGKNSKALNMGSAEMAPTLDASLNKRSLGNFVNIGAYEYTKIDESNEVFTIISEISDRQIHSKGKGDWDGQPQIRVGGVGEDVDGAGIFPFKIPLISEGKKIMSASFNVYLSKTDNQPQGGVDLYGLTPKANYWVTEDMYYQGTYGQDITARPIQNDFIDSSAYAGETKMSSIGKKGLKNYLNTVLETGSKPGDYVFLRMNPNSKDVTDYNRWNIVSANSNQKENHPKLQITVGYPILNTKTSSNIKSIENIIITSANPVNCGNVSFYFIGFETNIKTKLKLLNFSGEEVFSHSLIPSNLKDYVFRTKNLKLSTGKYFLEYQTDGEPKKQILFVW